jgi:rhodanese-related sulfurtransferase
MSVKQISPEQANEVMQGASAMVYIDVRTEPEFENGHPPGAINIPVFVKDPGSGQMMPNQDFLKVVESNVSKDQCVIAGCQMGGRSQHAGELLVKAGYPDVSNMQGGFGGARDPMGQLVVAGWLQLEFPVETKVDESNAYQNLKKSAGS